MSQRKLSKLTSKYQATVPREIREFLLLAQGDEVVYEIESGKVTVRKATPLDLQYLGSIEATLSEWSSKNDEDAYEDL